MGRTYKRKLGARKYKDYNPDLIEAALGRIVNDGWSIRQTSAEYKIHFGTLRNKFNGLHIRKSGGQTEFSMEEERAFIKAVSLCGDWGFPLNMLDVRYLAKSYLESQGRICKKIQR